MQLGGIDMSGAALDRARATQAAQAESRLARQDGDPAAAADQMQRLFATMLVKQLRSALPNGFFGKGPGTDIFEGWFDEQLGNSLSESGALDLAGRIKLSIEQKIEQREAAARAATSEPRADEHSAPRDENKSESL